ncbi:unnamed protein product [Arctia plantaginis]|uniref:Pre-C2HC domain-containing protein n=1 Tax=Arctia plantaginis TaxID=874455 RepID=A0A8S1AY59_ARCPL|nr:unnamed protein product [Arctia plantaginis]
MANVVEDRLLGGMGVTLQVTFYIDPTRGNKMSMNNEKENQNKPKMTQQVLQKSMFARVRSPSLGTLLIETPNQTIPKDKVQEESNTSDTNDAQAKTNQPWQNDQVPMKRKAESSPERTKNNTKVNKTTYAVTTENRFQILESATHDEPSQQPKEPKPPKPEPIFVTGVIDITTLKKILSSIVNTDKYTMTTLRSGHIVKIMPGDVDTYKNIRANFIENNVSHYTYKLKSERAYRVVLRGLHSSEDTELIKKELFELGHEVRHITNVQHKNTKQPLPLFYVDLEPKHNNKEIFKINRVNYVKVSFEAPYKKLDILQCKRCQRFGHAKNQCNRPFRCVKCGEEHSTTSCLKRPDTEATCANCQEKHPASYKGCIKYKQYKDLLSKNKTGKGKERNGNTNNITQNQYRKNPTQTVQENHQTKNYNLFNHSKPNITYAQVTKQENTAGLITDIKNPNNFGEVLDAMFNKFQNIINIMLDNMMDQRRQELELFLKLERVDVALISETRFTPKTHFQLKNYMVYTTNHPSGNSHGGTAIIIKENIKHYLSGETKTEKIQATSVRIQDNKTETTVSAIYCPPRHVITRDEFKTYFNTLGNRFICGGDWNAKHAFWGSRLTSPRGRQLYVATIDLNLHCASHGVPTYWPTDPQKVPDLLDFFITKNIPLRQMNVEECTDLSSDHTPVIVNVHCKAIIVEYQQRLYNRTTDWDRYRTKISESINLNLPLNNVDRVETAIETLSKLIHLAAKESTSYLRPKTTQIAHYPKLIKDKVNERRLLRKKWHSTKYPCDKKAFNRASEELKHMICQAENERLQKQLTDLTPSIDTNYSLWKITKRLKRPKEHIPPIKAPDGKWAKTELEKAQVYAEYLKTIFRPLPSKDPEHVKEVTEYLDAPLQMSLPLKSASPNELRKEILQLQKVENCAGYNDTQTRKTAP